MPITDVLVFSLILVALFWDIKYHKIPNKLTLPVIMFGVLYGCIQHGLDGLLVSLQGLLLGIGVFLIPFTFGGIGGGDVKLMAAIGALKGWVFVLQAALLTALWGGVIALLAIALSRRFGVLRDFGIGLGLFLRTGGRAGIRVMLPDQSVGATDQMAVPYGIAIFAGTVSAYYVNLNFPG